MNKDNNYPTTMYESILVQMNVVLVSFTMFAFDFEKTFKQNLKRMTRNMYILAKMLSSIVVM